MSILVDLIDDKDVVILTIKASQIAIADGSINLISAKGMDSIELCENSTWIYNRRSYSKVIVRL